MGSGFLNQFNSENTLKSLFSFASSNKIITTDKNNLNFLNPYASRVGQLLLDNTTSNNCQPFTKLKKKNFDIILSFSSEHIADDAFQKSFKVYFGHHGDEGAMNADIVLPTPLYTEKNGIFINIEGRPQEAKKCHNPIGEAKEEWKILKELSNQLSLNFEINSFDELRMELSKNYPSLVNLHEVIHSVERYDDQSDIIFESSSCVYPIQNFYMSDIISKNSQTMAKCVEDILSKPLLEKSA